MSFQLLSSHYPATDPCDATDSAGKRLFENQCAIRLSHALRKSGVRFSSFPKTRKCWVHPLEDHVLAAKELADWLSRKNVAWVGIAEDVTSADWRSKVLDRTGIICFENYYAASAGGGGDHIDLWNGTALTGLGSWLRVRFNLVVPGFWSDFRRSKRIRFFPVK